MKIFVEGFVCGVCMYHTNYAMTMAEAVDLTKDNIFYDSHCYQNVIVRVKSVPHLNQVKIDIIPENGVVIHSYRLSGDCPTLKEVESGDFPSPAYVPTCPAGWEKV